jgi:regulator of protease activity HflC (stomatin/prohibitin superfamily)
MLEKVILFACLVILIKFSMKVVRKDHCLIVFRLGRFCRVLGPGVVFLIPFVDKSEDINLIESFSNVHNTNNKDRLS